MFGPRGNSQARNLFSVIGYLQKQAGVELHVTPQPSDRPKETWQGPCWLRPETRPAPGLCCPAEFLPVLAYRIEGKPFVLGPSLQLLCSNIPGGVLGVCKRPRQ